MDYEKRELEREQIRNALNPIIDAIAAAEAELKSLSVFTSGERYRVGRARLELLHALRTLDSSQHPSERVMVSWAASRDEDQTAQS